MRRLNHSFVFFTRCPCSCCVAKSRRNCGIEKAQTMFEHVVCWCLVCICGRSSMLLWSCSWFPMSLVGGTRFSGPNISRFRSSILRCSFHRFKCLFVFELMVLWLLRIFVLSGESWVPLSRLLSWIDTSYSAAVLLGGCEQHHVVGKSQVRQAVSFLVAQVNSHSLFLPSLNNVFLMHTAAPCWTAGWTSDHPVWNLFGYRKFHSLRLSVLTPSDLYIFFKRLTYPWSTLQDRSASQIELWEMESKFFVKSTVAVHMLIHHSWHFCSVNL